jgi:cytochrome c2
MKTILISALVLIVACAVGPTTGTTVTPGGVMFAVHGQVRVEAGDAEEGKNLFTKLRCDMCHSVNGKPPNAPYPIRDLSRHSPESVAGMITQRSQTQPDAKFDEMAMASAASFVTQRQLADLVAYLRR